MSVRPLAVRRVAPLAVLFLLPLLSGCGPTGDKFPPACPAAGLVPPTGDITLYRPGSSRHDLVDQVLRGRVVAINGKCQDGDAKNQLDVDVTVSFEFTRGAAMQGNAVSVPVFVAVTEGDHILDKHVYGVDAGFPPNVDQVTRTSAPIHMSIPVSAAMSGAAYTIVAGFQLTADQLAAARARQ